MPDNQFEQHIRDKLADYQAQFEQNDWALIAEELDQADWDSQIRTKLVGYEAPFDLGDWQFMANHLDSPFDTYIRKQLTHFTSRFNPADWARMAQLLDDSLESSIRARLEDHSVPFRPVSDWPLMVNALDLNFDDAIRDKFAGYSQESEMAADWELIASELVPAFDQVVQEKLEAHSAPYHEMEWLRMAAVLDAADDDDGVAWYVRWQTYAVAASFILLAMLGVGSLQVLSEKIWPPTELASEVIPSEEKLASAETETAGNNTGTPSPNQTRDAIVSSQEPDTDESSEESVLATAGVVTLTEGELTDQTAASNRVTNSIEAIDLASTALQQDIPLPLSTTLASVGSVEDINVNVLPGELQEGTADNTEPRLMADSRKSRKDIELTAISHQNKEIGLGFFQSSFEELLGKNAPNLDSRVNLKNPEVRLGIYTGSTHSVAELNDASKPGYAVGLRAEIRFDDAWSIVSGISYTNKQLSHNYYIFADDRTQWENILDAKIKSLEVPVLVRYRFPATENQKVQLYAQAGIATMVTLEESYARYNPLSFENSDRISRNVDRDQHIPTNQRFTLNTYVGNIQAAAGIEYKVSKRLSLELEPYFQWGLQPMGTEQKQLHTVGVGAAMIYNLNNKSS